MTNAEIIAMQRAARAHREALPAALEQARALTTDFNGQPMVDGEVPRDGLTVGTVRTLVLEIERLQARAKDYETELREASREVRDAYSEGHFNGREEASRG